MDCAKIMNFPTKLRDRLNPTEFYEAAALLSRYWFFKESVMGLNRKIGPTVTHGSETDMQLYNQEGLNSWWL